MRPQRGVTRIESESPPERSDASGTQRTCSNCGRILKPGEWHPVGTGTDPDGGLVLHVFCGEDCQTTWTE
jgi:hypothetical protein